MQQLAKTISEAREQNVAFLGIAHRPFFSQAGRKHIGKALLRDDDHEGYSLDVGRSCYRGGTARHGGLGLARRRVRTAASLTSNV